MKFYYFQKAILIPKQVTIFYKHIWSHLFVEHSKLFVSPVLVVNFLSMSLFVSRENSAVYLLEQL